MRGSGGKKVDDSSLFIPPPPPPPDARVDNDPAINDDDDDDEDEEEDSGNKRVVSLHTAAPACFLTLHALSSNAELISSTISPTYTRAACLSVIDRPSHVSAQASAARVCSSSIDKKVRGKII